MSSREREMVPLVPWKAADVAKGVALATSAGLRVIIPTLYLTQRLGLGVGGGGVVATALLGCVMLLVAWRLGPAGQGAPITSLGFQLPASTGHLFLPLLVLLGSLAFNNLYVNLVDLWRWEGLLPPPLPAGLGLEGLAVAGGILLVVVWGPLAEEVFFRGFVFAGLVGRWGLLGAVLSSLLFALAHGIPGVMIPAFFTGMLLAWLYYRTRSLWGCFLAHAAQNALAVSLAGF